MRKIILTLAVLVILTNSSYSANKKKVLTVKDMLKFKTLSQLSLSFDDSRVAFVVKKHDFEKSIYNQDIWVVNVKKKEAFKFAFSVEE